MQVAVSTTQTTGTMQTTQANCSHESEEARELSAAELTGELGPLPPMKIHCGQLVEGALRSALDPSPAPQPAQDQAQTLSGSLQRPAGKLKIVPLED